MILLGCALPTTALAMYCDITYRVWAVYLLLPLLHGIACRAAILSRASFLLIIGNLVGLCTNYGAWFLVQTEQWDPYFKWTPSSGRMFSFLAVSLAIQLWFVFYNYAKRHWNKA